MPVNDLTLDALAAPRTVRRRSTGRECLMLGWWRDPAGRALFAAVVSQVIPVAVADLDLSPLPKNPSTKTEDRPCSQPG